MDGVVGVDREVRLDGVVRMDGVVLAVSLPQVARFVPGTPFGRRNSFFSRFHFFLTHYALSRVFGAL